MTSIVTKNGAVIVKDGKVAEDCGCCGNACDSQILRLRLSVDGLPTISGSQYDARPLSDDNGTSFTLHRQQDWLSRSECVWSCSFHNRQSDRADPFYYCETNGWIFSPSEETLTLRGNNYQAVFTPPSGKSFKTLPIDGMEVVCIAATGDTAELFSDVSVSVDAGEGQYIPCACPYVPPGRNTTCVIGTDTHQPPGEFVGIPFFACSTNESNYRSPFEDLPVTLQVSGEVIEQNAYVLGLQTRTLDFSALSGDYDLAWKNFAPSSRPQQPAESPAPPGSQRVQQGYGIDHEYGQWRVLIAVKPTWGRWTRANDEAVVTPCGGGQRSWGITCAFYCKIGQSVPSLIYYTLMGAVYEATQCGSYSCGQSPQFSFSHTMPIQTCGGSPFVSASGSLSISLSSA